MLKPKGTKIIMKIGMIGCGSMGRTHSFAVEALRFFYKPLGFEPEIAAVSAAHYESAMAAAEELHIKRAAASEDELISDPDIDIQGLSSFILDCMIQAAKKKNIKL